MIRIFIAATPYHILLAHIIIDYLDSTLSDNDNKCNHLIQTNSALGPNNESIINHDKWSGVHRFDESLTIFRPKQAINKIAKWVERNIPDNKADKIQIFTGNDTDWKIQLLISTFNDYSLNLFEDGIGSYIDEGWSNSLTRRIIRKLLYKPLFRSRYFNTMGLSKSDANQYYSFRDFSFPNVKNIKSKLNILNPKDSNYTRWLNRKNKSKFIKQFNQKKPIIILSEPLADYNVMSAKKENILYSSIAKKLRDYNSKVMWIMKHPSESDNSLERKMTIMRMHLPGVDVKICETAVPCFEVLLLSGLKLNTLIGIFSTALVNANLIAPDQRVLSSYNLLDKKLRIKFFNYYKVLSKVGVKSF